MPQPAPANDFDFAASGRRVFAVEAEGLAAVADRIDGAFSAACKAILASRGRVVCCGMGLDREHATPAGGEIEVIGWGGLGH